MQQFFYPFSYRDRASRFSIYSARRIQCFTFVDDGLATQNVLCKRIVVKPCQRQISGIINDYTEVLAFDPCKNTLTVTNSNAYNIGDPVLLIQMKGAVIDTTNTAAFGSVTDYKNAGNYGFNYVKSKTGNLIELKNFLTKQYDIPDGKCN
ncbi:MAG: hypothetical protein WDO71_26695 [Bacteroidota bacterium]